jgi:hypothetical protein
MSTPPKKGFSAFIRQVSPEPTQQSAEPPRVPTEWLAASDTQPPPLEPAPERVRYVTSTGRVRTHMAKRELPGVTLRLSEERWEKLKMLSIQERRPIQDILGESLDAFMRARGLPW